MERYEIRSRYISNETPSIYRMRRRPPDGGVACTWQGLSMLQVLEVPAFLIEAFPRTRRRFKHCRLTQDGSYEAKQWRSCGLRHEG